MTLTDITTLAALLCFTTAAVAFIVAALPPPPRRNRDTGHWFYALLAFLLAVGACSARPPQAPAPPQAPPTRDCGCDIYRGCICENCTCTVCKCTICNRTILSSHGNLIEFRKAHDGTWVPVGEGWRLVDGYWTRESPATSGAFHLAPPVFAPMPLLGGFGGGFGGGGRGGC